MHFHFLFFALCLCIFAGVFLFQCLCLLLGFTHYLFFGVSHDLLTDLPSAHPVLISLCAAWVDRKIRQLQMRNRETAVVNLSLLEVTPNEVVFIVKEERLLIFSLNAYAVCSGDAHTHCISQRKCCVFSCFWRCKFASMLLSINFATCCIRNGHMLLKIHVLCWHICWHFLLVL